MPEACTSNGIRRVTGFLSSMAHQFFLSGLFPVPLAVGRDFPGGN